MAPSLDFILASDGFLGIRMDISRVCDRIGINAWLITLLIALGGGESLAGESGQIKALSHADLVSQATQQSAAKHRIERLPDGQTRVPSPMQALEARGAPEGVEFRSTIKEGPGAFTLRAISLGRAGGASEPVTAGEVQADPDMARLLHANRAGLCGQGRDQL